MKNRFSGFVLRRSGLIIAFFTLTTLVCAVLQTLVRVNYNMVTYLPADAPSTHALDVMQAEFTQTAPNARVMIPDVTVQEALSYKARIAAVDGVSDVLWLDDAFDLKTPLEMADPSLVETYYKDGAALYSLAVRKTEEVRIVDALRQIAGENGAVSGEAVGSATFQGLAVSESTRAIALLVPVIVVILLLSTTSWLEPLLFLLAIAAAVLINMGTNLLFSEVSYITFSISPILQMAVSLDYAIFLLHSFEAYRQQTDDIHEAMALAMKRSFPAVLASALTTLLGFLVLTLMRFRIGADLGINLAKGIVLSLISSMVFLPALTVASVKLLDKTRHRSLMPSFSRFSKAVTGLRIPALLVVLAVLVPVFLAQNRNAFTYGTGELDRTQRAGQDELLIEEAFGRSTPMVLLVPRGQLAAEAALSDALQDVTHVTSVVSYASAVGVEIPSAYLDDAIVEQFYSEHYSRIILYASTPAEGEAAFSVVESVRALARQYYGDAALVCGESVNLYDMRDVVTADNTTVNVLAVFTIGLVLMLTFKSLALPLILLITIETAIWINLSFPYFSSTPLCYIGYLVISTVQLGATVDYAILFSDHYMANRKKLLPREAVKATVQQTTGSILISGTILAAAGFTLGLISSNDIVATLGNLIGRGALLSLVMVLFFLPAALTLLDPLVRTTTIRAAFRRKEKRSV